MYLAVCPLRGQGYDSSAGEECISLSVLSVVLIMIAQWKNECISLSVLSLSIYNPVYPTVYEF